MKCPKEINNKIVDTDWTKLKTAFGSAEGIIPSTLRNLYCSDNKKALDASVFLWSSLCHENKHVSSASLPSYQIISERIKDKNCNEKLKLELLDLVFHFVCCTNKTTNDSDYQCLLCDMKTEIKKDLSLYEEIAREENNDRYVSIFAEEILYQLKQ